MLSDVLLVYEMLASMGVTVAAQRPALIPAELECFSEPHLPIWEKAAPTAMNT